MSNQLGKAVILAAAAAGTKSLYDYLTTSKHDRTLRSVAKSLDRNTVSDVTLRVDHGIDIGEGSPKSINNKKPDFTLTHFPSSTFVAGEVETSDSLSAHAKSRLEAFARKDNYECVLVMPDGEVAEAKAFVNRKVVSDITVTSPSGIVDDLL